MSEQAMSYSYEIILKRLSPFSVTAAALLLPLLLLLLLLLTATAYGTNGNVGNQ